MNCALQRDVMWNALIYTEPIYKTLPIDQLFNFKLLIHAHALFYKSPHLPNIFINKIVLNLDIHNYQTRSCSDFHKKVVNSTYGTKLSSYKCATLWNSLPPEIKEITSTELFKKKLKNHLAAIRYNFSSFLPFFLFLLFTFYSLILLFILLNYLYCSHSCHSFINIKT